jgi:CheY-like chemotaxis protein
MNHFVLVVDDDADVRDTFELILKSSGYDVLTAANGSEALDILRAYRDKIALVLLDILMPVMDGWKFLEERSKSDALEEVPTVILSAAHPSNPISSHATAFLSKPVAMDDLLSTIRKYFPAT